MSIHSCGSADALAWRVGYGHDLDRYYPKAHPRRHSTPTTRHRSDLSRVVRIAAVCKREELYLKVRQRAGVETVGVAVAGGVHANAQGSIRPSAGRYGLKEHLRRRPGSQSSAPPVKYLEIRPSICRSIHLSILQLVSRTSASAFARWRL